MTCITKPQWEGNEKVASARTPRSD